MENINKLIKKLCPNGVEYRKLDELLKYEQPTKYIVKSTQYDKNYKIPVLTAGQSFILGYTNEENGIYRATEQEPTIIFDDFTTSFHWVNFNFKVKSSAIKIIKPKYDNINFRYIYYAMSRIKFIPEKHIRHWISVFSQFTIPVPPMEVQCEIVRILDRFTRLESELESKLKTELEARKKQYEYYRNKLLNFDETENRCGCTHTHTHEYSKEQIEWMELGKIGCVRMCKRILKSQTNTETGVPFYKIGTFGKKADAYISEKTYNEYKNKYKFPKKGDILISCSGTIGRIVVYNGEPAYFQDSNIVWLEHDETIVLNKYLKYCYLKNPWNIPTGGTIARLYNDNILKTKIPVPSLEEQERIVKILDEFEKICNDISEELPAEIEARQKQYEYYRDKLLTFKELKVEN